MQKKILIIGPEFFGYTKLIARAFESRKYYVDIINERIGSSFFAKLITRLGILKYFPFAVEKKQDEINRHIIHSNYQYIVFFNPETVSESFVRDIVKKTRAKVLIYFWDSFQNKRGFTGYLGIRGVSYVSFDPRDCEKYELRYQPLFYDDTYVSDSINYQDRCFFISCVCTIHSERILFLSKLYDWSIQNKKHVFIYLYYHSLLQLLIKFIRYPIHCWKLRYFFKEIPLTHNQISQKLKSSINVLDVSHPSQSGLTSRTFESLAAGCRLITTNKSIERHQDLFGHYILVKLDDLESSLSTANEQLENDQVPESINKALLHNWVGELIYND